MNAQLELTFANNRKARRPSRPVSKRSDWWFGKMRQAVEHAIEWQPMPAPRPEQIYILGVFRQPAQACALRRK